MPSSKPEGVWADQPFQLLETPGKTRSLTNPTVYVASHMALVHNTFIRALNTIYLQAPHIPPTENHSFLIYCQAWSALLSLHHKTEEALLFPALEARIPSAKGILTTNVSQHEDFHDGLEKFERYCAEGIEGKVEFDAKKLQDMIDGFAETLMKHLAGEIETLMSLDGFGMGEEVMKIHEEYEVQVRKNIDAAKIAPLTLLNTDKTFEGGEHPYPVMPWFVPYVVKYILSRKYAGAWKFGCCDYWGQPRTLWMHRVREQ
ncbi:hypothetical protein MMC12_001117 [Toensbergia leucococca]|nr:hypothetical protein [Toensbergia leucococca]